MKLALTHAYNGLAIKKYNYLYYRTISKENIRAALI